MFENLDRHRPFAILDLETTGTDPKTARIVEISVLKVWPDGRSEQRTRRLNPGMPIPAAASAIHGIRDEDVADAPCFAEVATPLLTYLDGCDLGGFNVKHFDLRVLRAELQRAGQDLQLEGRAVVDAFEIFCHFERRDLSAAVRFYCGHVHENAHGAAADVLATAQVLNAMLARYSGLPRSINGLQQFFKGPNGVDGEGRFHRIEGQIRFNFGKFRGQPLHEVAQSDPGYLEWMLGQDFAEDIKELVRRALQQARQGESDPF
jgi:DNA polymerase-3 subunit epsilon